MTPLATRRLLAPALLLLPVLSACVATPANPSAARASVLAGIVSRASACNAGYARRDTLDRFLQAERARGATPEQIDKAAVAKRPAVLLCDEPTGALDIETGKVVLDAIDRINRELGTTTAVITHNAAISRMAHRVFSFADGRVVETRTNETRARVEELVW